MASLNLRAVPRQHRSLREQVAETLRRAIVHGDLAPGQRLLEEDLAEQLQMSRGPIREALRKLEQEGLIASFPYRGTVVAETWDDEVVQVLMPIRATLEEFALHNALPRLTDADFAALAGIVAEMEATAEARDLAQLVELDISFHRLLMERSGQFHSLQLWSMIVARILGFFYRMGPYPGSLKAIARQHRTLLRELRSGDEERARAALTTHISEPKLIASLGHRAAAKP